MLPENKPIGTGARRLRDSLLERRPSLVAYVPIGDPESPGESFLDTYASAGVDVLEVGLPSPRPSNDGPVMAASMRRAWGAGTDGDAIAGIISEWRRTKSVSPSVVWMCYADADLSGLERWAAAGAIDGVLMLGDPPSGLADTLRRMGVAKCDFLSWEMNSDERRRVRTADGYTMVPTRPGVTGTETPAGDPSLLVQAAREINPAVPVIAGFGIGDRVSARSVLLSGVDGVVVGTACISAIRRGGAEGLALLLGEIDREIEEVRHHR